MNRVRVASQCRRLLARVNGRARQERVTLGFTLVELLVVVVVMLILIVMTVSAVDFAFTQERLKAGARQLQSALAGARDRAIYANEVRGLRLLTDENDPRQVTSMIYIGAPSNWTEGQIRLERVDDNGDGVADLVVDTNNDGTLESAIKIVRGDALCGWYTLKERGFLGLFEDRNLNGQLDSGEDQNGNGLLDLDAPRITIEGATYSVLTYRLTPTNQVLELVTPYGGPGTTASNEVVAFQGSGPNTYELELPPRVLPEAQPILLPASICIDLDGSLVPVSWRPAAGSGLTTPYSSHMDILFSPRGVVTGPLAAMGLVHLYMAERKDVQKTIDLLGRAPVNSNAAGPLVPGQNQFSADDPIGQRVYVTVFTQTGKVSSFQIDDVDTINNVTLAAGSDGYADSPFSQSCKGSGGVTNQ